MIELELQHLPNDSLVFSCDVVVTVLDIGVVVVTVVDFCVVFGPVVDFGVVVFMVVDVGDFGTVVDGGVVFMVIDVGDVVYVGDRLLTTNISKRYSTN